MTRSKWKGPYFNETIFRSTNLVAKKLIDEKYLSKNNRYFIWNRNSSIPSFFVTKRVAVYTGKRFHSFIVKRDMIDHKFGEFAATKMTSKRIHTYKNKKGKKVSR